VADVAALSAVPVDALATDAIAYVATPPTYYGLRRGLLVAPDGARYVAALTKNVGVVWERLSATRAAPAPIALDDDRESGALNARWYGAKGDKVTNDTAALRAWLAASYELGRPLYLPAGNYKVTGKLTIYPNTRLFGDGYASAIWYTGIVLSGSGSGSDRTIPVYQIAEA